MKGLTNLVPKKKVFRPHFLGIFQCSWNGHCFLKHTVDFEEVTLQVLDGFRNSNPKDRKQKPTTHFNPISFSCPHGLLAKRRFTRCKSVETFVKCGWHIFCRSVKTEKATAKYASICLVLSLWLAYRNWAESKSNSTAAQGLSFHNLQSKT